MDELVDQWRHLEYAKAGGSLGHDHPHDHPPGTARAHFPHNRQAGNTHAHLHIYKKGQPPYDHHPTQADPAAAAVDHAADPLD